MKVKSQAGNFPLRVISSSDGQFYDRDLPNSYKTAGRVTALSEVSATDVVLARAFIGETRTVLFEYDLASGAILCDGSFGQRDDYTKYTPFAEWTIDLTSSKIHPGDLDWSGFTGISCEFLCDVTLEQSVS